MNGTGVKNNQTVDHLRIQPVAGLPACCLPDLSAVVAHNLLGNTIMQSLNFPAILQKRTMPLR